MAVEAHVKGYAKKYVADSVREYMNEIIGRWGQSDSVDNSLADAISRQLQVHLPHWSPLAAEPARAPVFPTDSLPPELHSKSVYVVQSRADLHVA